MRVLKRPWSWPVLAVALVFVVGSIKRFGEEFHPQMDDEEKPNMTIIYGKYYRTNEQRAFTGYIRENYPGGQLKSRAATFDGLLDGATETWYPNGQLKSHEEFREGVSDGVRKTWHENGKQATEATIVKGKLNGPYRKWHENGQLAEQMTMQDDVAEGLALAWYPSGFLKSRVRVEFGRIVEQQNWKDGEQRGDGASAGK